MFRVVVTILREIQNNYMKWLHTESLESYVVETANVYTKVLIYTKGM